MGKHTEGAWRVDPTQPCKIEAQIRDKDDYDGGWDEIAEAFIGEPQEMVANARLIASAPELLDACHVALSKLGNNPLAASIIEKAINKAERGDND